MHKHTVKKTSQQSVNTGMISEMLRNIKWELCYNIYIICV